MYFFILWNFLQNLSNGKRKAKIIEPEKIQFDRTNRHGIVVEHMGYKYGFSDDP